MYIGTRHLHRINKWSAQTVVRNEIGRVGTVTISSIDDIVLDRCKYGILNIAFLVFIIFVRYQEMFSLYFFLSLYKYKPVLLQRGNSYICYTSAVLMNISTGYLYFDMSLSLPHTEVRSVI